MKSGVPGRRPKVTFPIRRTVVLSGRARELIIPENTTVACVFCGEAFLINADTAAVRRTVFGEWETVRCPRCNRVADAYFYLREPPRPPRPRNPEMVRIPWRTPEDW